LSLDYLKWVFKNFFVKKTPIRKFYYAIRVNEIFALFLLFWGGVFKMFELQGYTQLLTMSLFTLSISYFLFTWIPIDKRDLPSNYSRSRKITTRTSFLGLSPLTLGELFFLMKWSPVYMFFIVGMIVSTINLAIIYKMDKEIDFNQLIIRRLVMFLAIGVFIFLDNALSFT